MRRVILLTSAVLMVLLSLTACSGRIIKRESNGENKTETYKLSSAELPQFKEMEQRTFDVLELTFSGNTPKYKRVGEVSNGQFRMNDLYLRFSYSRPESRYDEKTNSSYGTGRIQSEIPRDFWKNIRNEAGEIVCEGIIVFEKVPFSFYYNEDSEPFIKCLEVRFDRYFDEDRSYIDFINFAKDYVYIDYITEEDLLSR
ncbi:MAG: hypothetical protein E7564_10520 [Ruminococcaceae bacterium]|nr:hypothetical protein [Oscillospiraceae bacterium]